MTRRLLLFSGAVAMLLAPIRGQGPPQPQPKPPAQPQPQAPSTLSSRLLLVRYDMPRGLSDGFAPTRQLATRKEGPDGVDWPSFTLNGQPLWAEQSDVTLPLKLRKGAAAGSLFRMPDDEVIEPGGHWLRPLEWQAGRKHIYTADRTARCGVRTEAVNGLYELWTFPVVLRGEGGPVVRNVEVKANGRVIYHQEGPWRSLTLLLPANERGKPYELTVAGRGPVKFDAGLSPVKLGDPSEQMLHGNLTLPGDGPRIAVESGGRPEEFPNPKEWAADLGGLSHPLAPSRAQPREQRLARYLGIEVPASPFTIYAAGLPHGMSGGFYHKGMNPEAYAAAVADLGFDTIFEPVTSLPAPEDPESLERRAAALATRSIRFGLQYDQNWSRPALQHPNLAMLAHTLPEWHAPLYRSLSLAAQRFTRLPNFAGLQIGADNAGYVSSWPTAPPIPDRPWGEAMIEFAGDPHPKVPRAPSLGPPELPFEQPVATEAEFLKYVERYENVFRQYGYFAEAVRAVDPKLIFTTGSFGSSPGTGARGGWPWASLPGRVIFEGLTTQQAYDWNSTHAAKPLHNVALTDRLHSYHPRTRTWALLDNFRLLYGREAWQRACALALTRGIQGIGTNFIASPGIEGDHAESAAAQKEMNLWMQRYGAVYARTEPEPVIGIFYGQFQALQRRVLTGENPSEERLLQGSHEGKVTEALFFCHAAGWPARVITLQELLRGPLPSSMKALLLVGLQRADNSWVWSAGAEPALQGFLDRGGRILSDDESFSPVPATPIDLHVAAYVSQSNVDATPLLFARNEANITKLRAAMADIAPPVAVSTEPHLWAIPALCGDTQYVTAINQSVATGDEAREMLRPADPRAGKPELWKTKANASLYVPPQTGALTWHTDRPIYDVRSRRKLTPQEAATVNLTHDAFAWYALPPAEVVAPEVVVTSGGSGFYEAKATMNAAQPMSGIPVEIKVSGPGPSGSATVYSATGQLARLPLNLWRDSGEFTVTVTELLTGLSSSITLPTAVPPGKVAPPQPVSSRNPGALSRFATRKKIPLTIALTPEQQQDPAIASQARALADYYRQRGRMVGKVGLVGPGGIVESLQVSRSPNRYPQWLTIPSDLVLFGTSANNVLLRDQERGQLFPLDMRPQKPGMAEIFYTRSPFVGEFDVVNILAGDSAGIAAAVQSLASAPKDHAR